jgi:hypothetical protein
MKYLKDNNLEGELTDPAFGRADDHAGSFASDAYTLREHIDRAPGKRSACLHGGVT